MRRLLVVAAVVGGLAVAASARGSTAFPILYTHWNGREQIVSVSSAGGDRRQLTRGRLNKFDPALSRDGTRIAYAWSGAGPNSDIWTMNADGSNPRRITFTPRIAEREPSWSPDGSKIAYVSGAGLWVMKSDGSDRYRVTAAVGHGTPSWSADGTKIAISDVYLPSSGQGHLVIVSLPSGRVRSNLPRGFAPSWSPDGKTIVFVRLYWGDRTSDLWLVNADGTGLRRLTNTALVELYPTWSPDGSQIALGADNGDDEFPGVALYVMNADGSGLRSLHVADDGHDWLGFCLALGPDCP